MNRLKIMNAGAIGLIAIELLLAAPGHADTRTWDEVTLRLIWCNASFVHRLNLTPEQQRAAKRAAARWGARYKYICAPDEMADEPDGGNSPYKQE